MRDFILRSTNGNVAIVTAIFDSGFIYAIHPNDASIDNSLAPTSEVLVDSVKPTLLYAYTDTIAALGAGWTFYRDGVPTVLDQNVIRVVAEEVPFWAFRLEIADRSLTAAVETALLTAGANEALLREFYRSGSSVRRESRFVKLLISSNAITESVANQIFRQAARSVGKL